LPHLFMAVSDAESLLHDDADSLSLGSPSSEHDDTDSLSLGSPSSDGAKSLLGGCEEVNMTVREGIYDVGMPSSSQLHDGVSSCPGSFPSLGEELFPLRGLLFDTLAGLESFLSEGGCKVLADRLVRVDGVEMDDSDSVSSLYMVMTGLGRFLRHFAGVRRSGPNAVIMVNCGTGAGDGFLSVAVSTRNRQGIAAHSPVVINYGNEYDLMFKADTEEPESKRFCGALEKYFQKAVEEARVADEKTGGVSPGTGGVSSDTGGVSPGTGGVTPGAEEKEKAEEAAKKKAEEAKKKKAEGAKGKKGEEAKNAKEEQEEGEKTNAEADKMKEEEAKKNRTRRLRRRRKRSPRKRKRSPRKRRRSPRKRQMRKRRMPAEMSWHR